jgi:hypothetical protein
MLLVELVGGVAIGNNMKHMKAVTRYFYTNEPPKTAKMTCQKTFATKRTPKTSLPQKNETFATHKLKPREGQNVKT